MLLPRCRQRLSCSFWPVLWEYVTSEKQSVLGQMVSQRLWGTVSFRFWATRCPWYWISIIRIDRSLRPLNKGWQHRLSNSEEQDPFKPLLLHKQNQQTASGLLHYACKRFKRQRAAHHRFQA